MNVKWICDVKDFESFRSKHYVWSLNSNGNCWRKNKISVKMMNFEWKWWTSNFRAIKLKPRRKLTSLKPRKINCSRRDEMKTIGFVQLVLNIVVKCGKFSATATTPIFFYPTSNFLRTFSFSCSDRGLRLWISLEVYMQLTVNVLHVGFLIGALPCSTPAPAAVAGYLSLREIFLRLRL